MKFEDAGQDAWEEATKPSIPSEDWNTPTSEEGKSAEDAHKDAWENEANDALKDSSKKVATKTIEKNEVKNNEKTLPQTNEKMNMGLVIGGISSAFMFFRRK